MTEQISALLDDEIALVDAEHLMAGMHSNGYASEIWSQYHLIGDVMRGANGLSPNFKNNLMAMIDLEPTVLSPNAASVNDFNSFNDSNQLTDVSANKLAPILKSKSPLQHVPAGWSIAASCAAVMVVGWMVLQNQVGNQTATSLVAQVAPTQQLVAMPVSNEQGVPAEYLMAHQASAPSASSYYIQSANYTE